MFSNFIDGFLYSVSVCQYKNLFDWFILFIYVTVNKGSAIHISKSANRNRYTGNLLTIGIWVWPCTWTLTCRVILRICMGTLGLLFYTTVASIDVFWAVSRCLSCLWKFQIKIINSCSKNDNLFLLSNLNRFIFILFLFGRDLLVVLS